MSGSSYGHLFRISTFGESHGGAVGVVVDGCPPGMELSEKDIQPDLDRRRPAKAQSLLHARRRMLFRSYREFSKGRPRVRRL